MTHLSRCLLPRRFGVLPAIAVWLLAAGTMAAEEKADHLLTDTWWDEPAHGLRVRQPIGTDRIDSTSDGALVCFTHPDGYRISIFIRENTDAFSLKELKRAAFDRFLFAYPSAVEIGPHVERPARMNSAALFLAVKDNHDRAFRWGSVFVTINDLHFVVFELEADKPAFKPALETLNQMIASMSLMDAMSLRELRAKQIIAAKGWREGLAKKPARPMPREQWFRIVQDGEEVGYERVAVETDIEALKKQQLDPGTVVKVQTRIADNARVYDTMLRLYESSDRAIETWDAKTTLRKNVNGVQRAATWADTGFNMGGVIVVTRDAPADLGAVQDANAQHGKSEKKNWRKPPVAYLSQVDLYRLIPYWPSLEKDVCFYAYDLNSGDLAQRLIRVNLAEDAGTVVSIRPTPEAGVQRLIYGPNGELRRREMADGRVFIATTADQIAKIWGIRR